jgi:hypothetical protein
MKASIMFVVLMFSISLFAATAVKKDSVKAAPKAQVQQVQKSEFDGIQANFKKQLSDLDKKKEEQKVALSKLEKENASLDSKSDSIYTAAKVALKATYDKELAKIVAQEQETKDAKAKLEASYQEALKAIEDAKGTKK